MERSFDQIISALRKGEFYPVYFLTGEEPYFIDQVTDFIEKKALPEEMKAFNQQVFYGKDSRIQTIVETAMRHPMMAERQVVIVKEAQELDEISREESRIPLEKYVENPNPATVLVLAYKHKKFDKRTRLSKTIRAKNNSRCVYLETTKIKEYKIPEWITQYLSGKGFSIDRKAAMLLTEYIGNSISNLINETEKLVIAIPEGTKKITPSHIERYIGYSKDYNIFELQNAIIARDVLKANRIVYHFCKNPKEHPLTVTIAVLYQFFVKILLYHQLNHRSPAELAAALKVPAFALRDYEKAARLYSSAKLAGIISALRKTDARSKGIGNRSSDNCDLLKEVLYYILH